MTVTAEKHFKQTRFDPVTFGRLLAHLAADPAFHKIDHWMATWTRQDGRQEQINGRDTPDLGKIDPRGTDHLIELHVRRKSPLVGHTDDAWISVTFGAGLLTSVEVVAESAAALDALLRTIAEQLDLGIGVEEWEVKKGRAPKKRDLSFEWLHDTVKKVSGPLLATDNLRHAVLDVFIALDTAVKERSGIDDYGDALMGKAFGGENPVLRVFDDRGEQDGVMHLFKGATKAVRNRLGHTVSFGPQSLEAALELLGFASLLFRLLDASTVARRPK